MKSFNKIFLAAAVLILILFAAANLLICGLTFNEGGRPYRVEAERLAYEIEKNGFESIDITEYKYISGAEKFGEGFYETDSDCIIKEINGSLYRFDYRTENTDNRSGLLLAVNLVLLSASAFITGVLIFVKVKILAPFERLSELPGELSRGNLTVPLKESKNRFFGKFMWGVNLLRENLEEQKRRELELQREKKTLLLSLSHDIKTPLSAIKLYAGALTRNLYADSERQAEIVRRINENADEIGEYLSEIISASKEDFLSLETKNSEFYLSELINGIEDYYGEKLALLKTEFSISKYENLLLKGDPDRSAEVLQNIIENAVKYGDGRRIEISFSQEEDCELITVKNSGGTLSKSELPHIFESFWRGSNAGKTQGSGLGLYICRQLMRKMNGEIYAETNGEETAVTVVFGLA